MPNTAGQSGQTYFDSPIFNGPTPHEGPRALAVNCPFTNEIAEFNIDLTLSQTQAYISVIQGVFVDNSDNADVVSITANGATNQTIDFPAGAQGYIPILATKPTSFNVASAGAVTVPLIFLNVSVPAIIWGESSGGGGGGGVIEITNPGSTPSPAPGASIAGSSDGSGNLMVMLNALNQNQSGGIYAPGNSQYLQTDGNNNLNVNINASETIPVVLQSSDNVILTAPYKYQNASFGQFSVGTSNVQLLVGNADNPVVGTIYNGGSTSIFVGGYNVTASTGFEVASKTMFEIPGPTSLYFEGVPGESGLWAVSESGTNNVSFWGDYGDYY